MSAAPGFAFSCDSALGCHAHAMVAGESVDEARRTLAEVLDWNVDGVGDLCPNHAEGDSVERTA
jgi:hypothetical protein